MKDICVDVVFGKDVDEIVQICNDMICAFIYTYQYISYDFIFNILLTNMYNILYIYILNFFFRGLSLFSAESFIQTREYSGQGIRSMATSVLHVLPSKTMGKSQKERLVIS